MDGWRIKGRQPQNLMIYYISCMWVPDLAWPSKPQIQLCMTYTDLKLTILIKHLKNIVSSLSGILVAFSLLLVTHTMVVYQTAGFQCHRYFIIISMSHIKI